MLNASQPYFHTDHRSVPIFFVCRAPTDDGSELKSDLTLLNSWIEKGLKNHHWWFRQKLTQCLWLLSFTRIVDDARQSLLHIGGQRSFLFSLTFISFTHTCSKPRFFNRADNVSMVQK